MAGLTLNIAVWRLLFVLSAIEASWFWGQAGPKPLSFVLSRMKTFSVWLGHRAYENENSCKQGHFLRDFDDRCSCFRRRKAQKNPNLTIGYASFNLLTFRDYSNNKYWLADGKLGINRVYWGQNECPPTAEMPLKPSLNIPENTKEGQESLHNGHPRKHEGRAKGLSWG